MLAHSTMLFGLFAVFVLSAHAYKPIVAMHGFSFNNKVGTNHDWDQVKVTYFSRVIPIHICRVGFKPATQGPLLLRLTLSMGWNRWRHSMFNYLVYCPIYSHIVFLWPGILSQIRNITSAPEFADGYHFLGHSQGGLIMRSMLELFDDHKVENFISLAGVQNGKFIHVPFALLVPHH